VAGEVRWRRACGAGKDGELLAKHGRAGAREFHRDAVASMVVLI